MKSLPMCRCFCSSSRNARFILKRIGYGDFFDTVVGCYDEAKEEW
ncbi:hypothetical protein [Lacrimispora sphenoides]|nr:hypothetical protein [Lacrimispora sphenoides]